MQGNFKLNTVGWYTAQNVVENDFLNQKLENDQYGIYYSVKFEGDAETYLWQAKTAPVEGEKYWGHIEESKSGKSLRFKKDKDAPSTTPDGKPSQQAQEQTAHGDAITASMCVKLAFGQFCHVEAMLPAAEEHWSMIEYMSDELYKIIKRTGQATQVAQVKAVFHEPLPPEPEEVELEIPPEFSGDKSRDWKNVGRNDRTNL